MSKILYYIIYIKEFNLIHRKKKKKNIYLNLLYMNHFHIKKTLIYKDLYLLTENTISMRMI